MPRDQRPSDEPRPDHLEKFRKAWEEDLRKDADDDIPPAAWEAWEDFCDNHQPASDTSEFRNRMIAHLIEVANFLRNHVYATTRRWPTLAATENDDDLKARDIAYLHEATLSYWKKTGAQHVPLDEVLEYRHHELQYASVFYDEFYAHQLPPDFGGWTQ